MFTKVLVANRGEIAVRVMRTLREMGIASVAVFSEADRDALHVAVADEAVCIGPPEPGASYLDIDRIVAAAHETGAQAVHPGYGFLSEQPELARRLRAEGLVFIGPSPEAMEKLGNKTTARALMRSSGVPVIPGMDSPAASDAELAAAAERVGYPVLVKAAAGGGGKGMRIVRTPEELGEAAQRARSEARAAFGDDSIYIEKHLHHPRHVELQILADTHGNAVHLRERECSIQRRHQKIIEETPSPALTPGLREAMGRAAVAAARAAGYSNAGTVEFLLDASGSFYFLEVNTRLQVEHPITEMITGLDLVRCQVEVAAGLALPFTQEEVTARGHAIECRIYAEDPRRGFMPSPGRVLLARYPSGPGIRYDVGIATGSEVPVYYDPILGKLVVHAPTREAAIERMRCALRECVILGVETPIELLIDVLGSEAFRAGQTHTAFLEEHFAGWQPDSRREDVALVGYLLDQEHGRASPVAGPARAGSGDDDSPWHTLGKWDLA